MADQTALGSDPVAAERLLGGLGHDGQRLLKVRAA